MSKTFDKVGLPILLTTITTMAGMLALSATGMELFKIFGISSAAGVFAAFLFTIFVLPALMDVWHPMRKSKKPGNDKKPSKLKYILTAMWLQPLGQLASPPEITGVHEHLEGSPRARWVLCGSVIRVCQVRSS